MVLSATDLRHIVRLHRRVRELYETAERETDPVYRETLIGLAETYKRVLTNIEDEAGITGLDSQAVFPVGHVVEMRAAE